MKKNNIYLCLAHMSGNEMKYIQEAFDTNWVVPLGPNVDAFEKDLENYIGGEHPVVALASGTSAIHLALVAMNVGPGDEVLCQSFTFAASVNPIVYQGASPVFIDSECKTWNMDPELLETAIKDRIAKTGKKPKTIILVYLYGMPSYIDEIMEVANRYEIPVIEDSAEAFGSVYNNKACGTFGRFGVMSFNGNKMITTSGGGALICPDKKTASRILYFATQARQPKSYYLHTEIGYNYRMSNICAGIGRGQMTIVNEHIAHHRHLKDFYVEGFRDVDDIVVHVAPENFMQSNYWLNAITFNNIRCTVTGEPDPFVKKVQQHLASVGVESRPLWKPMHTQPVFKDAPAYINGISEKCFSKGLCLPSGPYVTDEDAGFIVKEIKKCL